MRSDRQFADFNRRIVIRDGALIDEWRPPGGVPNGASFAKNEHPARACVGKGGASGTLVVDDEGSAYAKRWRAQRFLWVA
jgi:hypothetical protein